MRVCIIGDHSQPLDEGMKKTTHALFTALSKRCDAQVLNPLEAGNPGFWGALLHHHPDVIHYIPGPSLYSFMLLSLAKTITSASTVISLTHPDPHLPRKFACRFFKPDLLLTQSLETETHFKGLGCTLAYLPNGVDTTRFHPVSPLKKRQLRACYGIPEDAFVVLHVGNTRQVRNLETLTDLQKEGVQVVIVSSTTIQGDSEVDTKLKDAGCLVLNHYIEAIEEVYALADCYVFPTMHEVAAIAHPLSVMEAMACNLPVITRRFGALPRFFKSGDGFYFFESDETLKELVTHIQTDAPPVRTREQVAAFDWDAIGDQVIDFYQRLTKGKIA